MTEPNPPDLEVTHDFFDLWLKAYEATFGRMIDVPALGPSRERVEKAHKNVDITVNLYTTWMQSIASFQSVFAEATRRTQAQVASMEEGGQPIQSSKDFYELWMQTYSETFKEFLRSPDFASDLHKMTSLSMDYKKSNQEMLEENVLKPMALPTKSELEEIDKEVYELKRQVRKLTKQVQELSRRT